MWILSLRVGSRACRELTGLCGRMAAAVVQIFLFFPFVLSVKSFVLEMRCDTSCFFCTACVLGILQWVG